MPPTTESSPHMLRRDAVEAATGLSRSTIYRLMRAGQFPEPVKVGLRAVRWRESDLATWLASRPVSHGDGSDSDEGYPNR